MTSSSCHKDIIKNENLAKMAENGSQLVHRLNMTQKTRFWGQKTFMTSSSWHNDVIKYLIILKNSSKRFKLGIPTKHDPRNSILRSKIIYDVIIIPLWRHQVREMCKKGWKRLFRPSFIPRFQLSHPLFIIRSPWRHLSTLMTP